MISETTRMRRVTTADITPTQVLPKARAVKTPTREAPKVLAMVFIARMAAIGLSMEVLYFLNRVAGRNPSSSLIVIYEMGVDMSTASRMLQRKEMPTVNSRSRISRSM